MNYLLKYGLISFCMLCCPVMLMAQTILSLNETIQTPQTQNFVRYGNTPVNLNTGTIAVSIPIYTYKDNDFEIPIGLNYSSNGLIANQQTGIVGLGWYLNAGGVITRTVEGIPDETPSTGSPMSGYYKYHTSVIVDERTTTLSRGRDAYLDQNLIDEPFAYLANPSVPTSDKYETTPDIFHFNFMGYQGTFQFNINNKICIYNTNSSKYDFKIKVLNFYNRLLSSFEITTNDGYRYIFGGDQSGYYDRECKIHDNQLDRTVISWQLTKIIAPNGRTVSFIYRSGDYMSRGIVKNRIPSSEYMGVSTTQGGFFLNYEFKETSTFPTYLEKIIIDDVCQIQLDYSTKESEMYGTSNNLRKFPELLKLSSIDVNSLSPDTEHILHCDLRYQYSLFENKILFLKEVDFGNGKAYKMNYIEASTASFPLHSTCSVDHWGYYNGRPLVSLNNFIPSTTTKNYVEIVTGIEREANAFCSRLGMLEQISYPTGGLTQYEYEGNTYSRRNMDQYENGPIITQTRATGGVRIKAITDYTETGECNKRVFTYENSDKNSSGILLKMPRYRLNYTLSLAGREVVINRGNGQSMATYSLDEYHIEYARVLESRSNGTKTEYNYGNSFEFYNNDEMQIAEYDDGVYLPNQKITSGNARMVRFLLSRLKSKALSRGQLRSAYTTLNNDTIYSEEYKYINPGKKAPVFPQIIFTDGLIYNVRTTGDNFYLDGTITLDKRQVYSKITKEYINNKIYTTKKEYDYKSTGYESKVTCISTTMNNGDILKERIEYLQDDVPNLSEAEQTMLNSFITRTPLRIVHTLKKNNERTEQVIDGQYNVFKRYGNLLKLEETRKKTFTERPEWEDFNLNFGGSDFHNDAYDSRGNLTQQTGKDGSVTSYIWGYNHRYPIATVKNASLKDIEAVIGNIENISSAKEPDTKILSLKSIPGALVEQYRYKPLIGISTMTNTRGIDTHYEYDEEGQLKCVKDHDKNAVSQYDYHYNSTNNH